MKRGNLIPDLVALILCGLALIKAVQTMGDLRWPYDLDQFREIGMAQSILDHRYGTDHLYAGETIWYNPLTSAAIAAVSYLTATPAPLVVTRAAAYLNLLAPLAFYILVAFLFDRWRALAATAAFLFAPIGQNESFAAASYSPWLFSQNFAQGFFYLALASYGKALASSSWPWRFATGILLGLTFLGHTAPAILLGLIIVVAAVTSAFAHNDQALSFSTKTKEIRALLVIFAIAFVVSLPFTFSILFHYHLRVVNTVPSNWVYHSLALNRLPSFLRSFLSWFTLIALIGVWITIKSGSHRRRRILLLTWLIVCVLALVLNEIQQLPSSNLQLMFVPAHHFLFYLQALEDIFFGVGLVFICRSCANYLLSKTVENDPQPDLKLLSERALVGIGIVVFLALSFRSYLSRFDFTAARSQAIRFQERKSYLDAYRWILSNTKPEDVFLSLNRDFDLSIVGPADRKTLVTCQPEFSNPYISFQSRVETATNIVDKLARAAPDTPAALRAAHVNYIITLPMGQFDQSPFAFLSKKFAEDDVAIYQVISD